MVVNEADLEWASVADRLRRKQLAPADGGERIGCSLYELPPGERAWPYHHHEGNEEALYVLAGSGRLRTPDGTEALAAGDYAAFPPGAAGAHAVANDGDDVLRYLMISTMETPDVTVYPDSDTVGVFTGAAPGGDGDRPVHGYFPRSAAVDYWADVNAPERDPDDDG
jgi:uncharacterized cupin superfamily protein